MKNIFMLSVILILFGCDIDEGDGGSSLSTYSSCKILSSQALYADDRAKDVNQCWSATGGGYESKSQAMAWCEAKVNQYMDDEYIFGHTVTYIIRTTSCY